MTRSVQIPWQADPGKEGWVARITGRDPRTLYTRVFVETPFVKKPGLYEASGRYDKSSFYAVVNTECGDLIRVKITQPLLSELVDGWLHRMDQIVADPGKPLDELRDDGGSIRVRPAEPSPFFDQDALIGVIRQLRDTIIDNHHVENRELAMALTVAEAALAEAAGDQLDYDDGTPMPAQEPPSVLSDYELFRLWTESNGDDLKVWHRASDRWFAFVRRFANRVHAEAFQKGAAQ